jgi:hypothetical protein
LNWTIDKILSDIIKKRNAYEDEHENRPAIQKQKSFADLTREELIERLYARE